MTNSNGDAPDFQSLLSLDPLLEAEKITGKSYTDDQETANLGFALHILHSKNKAAELALRDDTHYSSPFVDALRIVQETGFEIIHDSAFAVADRAPSRCVLLWRAGVLIYLESYQSAEDREASVNNFTFWGNWIPNEGLEDRYAELASGYFTRVGAGYDSYPEGDPRRESDPWVWVGNWDGREAFRHQMARLDAHGTWLTEWLEDGRLWLVHYSQKKPKSISLDDTSDWYEQRTLEKLESAPTEIREMILRAIAKREANR